MANYRSVRVGDEIKTKISEIIPTLKDPRISGIVSVTRVEGFQICPRLYQRTRR